MGPAGALAILVLANAFSIFLVVIGIVHKDDCPSSRHLGEALIVLGSFGIIISILDYFTQPHPTDEIVEVQPPTCLMRMVQVLNVLLKLANIGLFVYLCYSVYKLYALMNYEQPDTALEEICNRTLFLVAFWFVMIAFGLIAVVILVALIYFFIC